MEGTLNYNSGTIATTAHTPIEIVNLCRDLSAINRKGFNQTSSKGVPLVYHCRITMYRTPDASDADLLTEMVAITAPQNWVYRNAAVKLHAARNKMFAKNGVTKSMLGRYAKTIRYGFSEAAAGDMTSYNLPLGETNPDSSQVALWDEDGSEIWDLSQLAITTDTSLYATLCHNSLDEESAITGAVSFNLAEAYLNSRKTVQLDDETDADTPASFSIIRDMFQDYQAGTSDEVLVISETVQDNPPYDADDIDGSFTQCVEQGRCHTGQGTASISIMNVDVPFGLLCLRARRWNAGGSGNFDFRVDVLGVSEMQG